MRRGSGDSIPAIAAPDEPPPASQPAEMLWCEREGIDLAPNEICPAVCCLEMQVHLRTRENLRRDNVAAGERIYEMLTQPIRVLIVEDHKPLREALARAARGWGAEVLEAGTVAEASEQLAKHPDLVIVDVALPDGSARPVVEQAVALRPAAAIIAMSGQASAEEAFELARLGARRYLPKPISLEDLTRAVEGALQDRPDLRPVVAAHVGNTPMRQVLERVRGVMVDEALAREHGSRSGAARRLGVSRQAVQQAVRLLDLGDDTGERRGRE